MKYNIYDIIKSAQSIYKEQGRSETFEELEQIVLDLNDPEWSYLFAVSVNGADVTAHCKVIVDSKDAQHCYYAALSLKNKGADIDLLWQTVQESNNIKIISLFGKHIMHLYNDQIHDIIKDKNKDIPYETQATKEAQEIIDYFKAKKRSLQGAPKIETADSNNQAPKINIEDILNITMWTYKIQQSKRRMFKQVRQLMDDSGNPVLKKQFAHDSEYRESIYQFLAESNAPQVLIDNLKLKELSMQAIPAEITPDNSQNVSPDTNSDDPQM